MPNIWFTSDWHLGHANILKFLKDDGIRLRTPFQSLVEMKDAFFDAWNEQVQPGDKVYCLGDMALTALGRRHLAEMAKLPGQKRLVRGNHDLYDDKEYHDAGFRSIYGVRQINGVWATHVPMHPGCLGGRARGNVHGHLHGGRKVLIGVQERHDGAAVRGIPDPRYFNVNVESLNYRLIHWDDLIARTGWDKKGMIE